ncbi:hypothetical protein JCM14469_30640 [Desulfatiferula olefinivorans]
MKTAACNLTFTVFNWKESNQKCTKKNKKNSFQRRGYSRSHSGHCQVDAGLEKKNASDGPLLLTKVLRAAQGPHFN